MVFDSRVGIIASNNNSAAPYTPSAEIQEVAAQVGFTSEAEELFWATKPQFGNNS